MGVIFIRNLRQFRFFTSTSNFSKIGACAFNLTHWTILSINRAQATKRGERAVTAQESGCLHERTTSSAVPALWSARTVNNNGLSHQGSSNGDRDTLSQKTGRYDIHIGKQSSKEVQIKKSLGVWQHQVPGVSRPYSGGSSYMTTITHELWKKPLELKGLLSWSHPAPQSISLVRCINSVPKTQRSVFGQNIFKVILL